ncbi:anti-repressor SinI family protein [Halobacillus shinanisalinarum]|uniref:Anti-repressor SinI family protein n=1 Tax=Halobacillus shinanisalinarum TaxID=2932258 RepID=A0ABY4H2M9_9BACI|nr:anti-repressor SinI family protein [Halobacillus shinanisalinarum]UOQ94413.1 anti-repressor SinI family protein [Halobacillus shinanisalinarum]
MRSFDTDWIALVKLARDIGFSKEEIKQFIMEYRQ